MDIKKLIVLIVLGHLVSAFLAAQVTIEGQITDENNEPITGAHIMLKGTQSGTVSDLNGRYLITPKYPDSDTLVFSFIGYNAEEVAVRGKSIIDVKLIPSLEELDEIVVIGYGSQKKKDLTGSVSTVTADQLKDMPVNNIAQAITGRMAGVQVTTTEGSPDAAIKIRVRGGGSITQDNSPLYIVDGFPVDGINDIAPADIESVTVLKDASSSSIYGSRGANGVVIITTRSGEKGKVSLRYNYYMGFKKLSNKLDVLDPYEYVLYQYERSRGSFQERNRFQTIYGTFDQLEGLYGNAPATDWQEEVFGTNARINYHNVNITGGQENSNYNLSYTYTGDEGIMIRSGYIRNNVNFKFQNQTFKNLKINFNARYSDDKVKGAGTSDPGTSTTNQLKNSVIYRPVNGLADPNEFFEDEDYYTASGLTDPVRLTIDDYRFRHTTYTTIDGGLTFRILNELNFKSEAGYNSRNIDLERFYGLTTSMARRYGDRPVVRVENEARNIFRITNTLNYQKLINDKHDVTILLGQELIRTNSKDFGQEIHSFPAEVPRELALGMLSLGTDPQFSQSYISEDKLFSWFGRILYNYGGKYLATFSLRADGSSKFWKSRHWGYFPSGSFAWRISQEEFMKNIDPITSLKLRVSFGTAGNNRIDNLLFLKRFETSSSKPYYLGEVPYSYLYQPVLPNPDLEWEKTTSRNAGLDMAVYKNRLTLSIDYYNNTTSKLLIEKEIDPSSSGGYETQVQNIGQTTNYGIEITSEAYIIEKSDFRLSANFNIAFNHSRVDKLDGILKRSYYSSGWNNDIAYDYVVAVGQPVGLIYGFVTDGFYTVDDFTYDPGTGDYTLKPGIANNSQLLNAELTPGSIKFKNIASPEDGSDDGNAVTNEDDRTVIGNANPKHIGGYNLMMQYKMFDLSVFLNWVYGNDIYNANRIEFSSGYRAYTNLTEDMNSQNRWMTVNSEGTVVTDPAELTALNAGVKIWKPTTGNYLMHSWAVEDGSFLRINNITLGITIPPKLTSRMYIKSLRFYMTGSNLLTFTKYSGYDPEVDTRRSTPLTPGVDYSAYPRSRSLILGLNLNF